MHHCLVTDYATRTDMKTANSDPMDGDGRQDCERGRDATCLHSAARRLIQLIFCCGLGLACAWPAVAQVPNAAPSALLFSYQFNGATPLPAQTVQVTVPTGPSGSILTVAVVTPAPWLTVTPDAGRVPLALTVRANPTGLTPGSYLGQITVTSPQAVSNPALISVTLSITNPHSSLSMS